MPLSGFLFQLVVSGLADLWDSISVYIGPSPKEREKEKIVNSKTDRLTYYFKMRKNMYL